MGKDEETNDKLAKFSKITNNNRSGNSAAGYFE